MQGSACSSSVRVLDRIHQPLPRFICSSTCSCSLSFCSEDSTCTRGLCSLVALHTQCRFLRPAFAAASSFVASRSWTTSAS